MTDAPRYRLGLTEPLFAISPPARAFRGLTERELDRLAGYLRTVEVELRSYDEAAAPLLADVEALPNPWWQAMRSRLLERGEDGLDAAWLDENCSCCYCAPDFFKDDPWFAGLVEDVRQTDPARSPACSPT